MTEDEFADLFDLSKPFRGMIVAADASVLVAELNRDRGV
jgi:hypothetical protein